MQVFFPKRLLLVLSFDNLILLKIQNIFFSRNQNVKWHSCSRLYYVILSYGFFCWFKKCGELKWFTPLLMAKVCGNIPYKEMANCFMTTSEIIFSSRILFRVRLFFAKCMQARTKETFTRGMMFWFFWDAQKLASFLIWPSWPANWLGKNSKWRKFSGISQKSKDYPFRKSFFSSLCHFLMIYSQL